jgi:hypothetical protein
LRAYSSTHQRLLLILGAAALLASALLFGVYLRFLLNPASSYNDFFVFWAAARDLQLAPLAQIYDHDAFDAFKQTLTSGHFSQLPFLYPPYAAFLFAPFGLLPLHSALLCWDALCAALYLAAVWRMLRPHGALAAAVALIAPATVVALLAGQTGLLMGALAVLGLSLLGKRPMVAGMVLGLLTLKPQLAALPCLVLLTGGHLRAGLAATATVAVLVAASLLAFGLPAWSGWLHGLSSFASDLDASGSHQQYGVSIYFTLLALGLDRHLALGLQLLAALLVLWTVSRALRREVGATQQMLVLTGLYLATPYAVVYDLSAFAVVCLMLIAEARDSGFRSGELPVIVAAWFMPLLLILPQLPGTGLGLVLLLTLFGLLLRRLASNAPATASQPPAASPPAHR